MIGKEREREIRRACSFLFFLFSFCEFISVEYYDSRKAKKREDMCLDFLYERGVEGDVCTFSRTQRRERERALSLKAPLPDG